MTEVSFEGVTKRFGDSVAVDGLTLHIPDRELLMLPGSPGCGKTTALRLVAGLEEVSATSAWRGTSTSPCASAGWTRRSARWTSRSPISMAPCGSRREPT